MYFEARIHKLREVKSAMEAAEIIKGAEHKWHEVLKWNNGLFNFYCVADGWLDNMKLELAILREETDGSLVQIESIKNGWIDSKEELGKYLLEAESASAGRKVQLITGKPKGDETAWFECGCCGSSFQGNVVEQLKHDQDAGYGICERCAAPRI